MNIKEEFMNKTKMIDAHCGQKGVEEAVDYLVDPAIIVKMIIASEMDLPVLTLIAKDLEKKFDKNSSFPVVVTDDNKNTTARQNIGRMIKFIMAQYGYTPIDGGLSERARIPAVSSSEYFSTSGVYKKTGEAKYEIEIVSKKDAEIIAVSKI